MRISLTLFLLFAATSIGLLFAPTSIGHTEEPLLGPGDRVALVGGSFFERMQSTGALEAEIQCRKPHWKLSFRNVGWSGDDVHGNARKRFDDAEDGFERVVQDIETADPTVVLIAYGFAEASDGNDVVERFEPGLRHLTQRITKTNRRIVLMTPLAMPGYRVDGYAEAIKRCREIVNRVGFESKIPVVAIEWQPSDTELDEQRIFPNAYGYSQFAKRLADQLVDSESCAQVSEELTQRIVEKNQLFFHRYRPQNETYLFLFRKHEQGNNAAEIPKLDPLIKAADKAIWEAAKSKE